METLQRRFSVTPDPDPRFLRPSRLPWVAVLGSFVFALWRVTTTWDELPRRMASHFGPSGRADGWMSREGFFAFLFLVGAGVVAVLGIAVPALLRRAPPEMINLPNRDYWLAPERKEQTLRRMAAWCAWFGALTTGFFAFALELTLVANIDGAPLNNGAFLLGLGVYAGGVAFLLVVLYRGFGSPRNSG